MMLDQEQFEKDCKALFGTPLGRNVLQQILVHASNLDAPGHIRTEELWMRQGARGLALDLCLLAGALPEVPGSNVIVEPPRHDTALEGAPPPEGDHDSDREERAIA